MQPRILTLGSGLTPEGRERCSRYACSTVDRSISRATRSRVNDTALVQCANRQNLDRPSSLPRPSDRAPDLRGEDEPSRTSATNERTQVRSAP